MSLATALDRGPQHFELALRTMLYEPGSLRLREHKGFLRVINAKNQPIFSIKIDELNAFFARLGNIRVPAPIPTSSSVPYPFFVRAPAAAVSFAGASVVASYAVFSLSKLADTNRTFKEMDRKWSCLEYAAAFKGMDLKVSCLEHATMSKGLRTDLDFGAQDTSCSKVFAHIFSRAPDSIVMSAGVSRTIEISFAAPLVDCGALLSGLREPFALNLISDGGSPPPPPAATPVAVRASALLSVGGAGSCSVGGAGSCMVGFMRRNWLWIAVCVAVVAVVILVALAVIFGKPAPVASLAKNIWQGSGNLASEGWRRLLLLLGKV